MYRFSRHDAEVCTRKTPPETIDDDYVPPMKHTGRCILNWLLQWTFTLYDTPVRYPCTSHLIITIYDHPLGRACKRTRDYTSDFSDSDEVIPDSEPDLATPLIVGPQQSDRSWFDLFLVCTYCMCWRSNQTLLYLRDRVATFTCLWT